jgi:hypothetical protein
VRSDPSAAAPAAWVNASMNIGVAAKVAPASERPRKPRLSMVLVISAPLAQVVGTRR